MRRCRRAVPEGDGGCRTRERGTANSPVVCARILRGEGTAEPGRTQRETGEERDLDALAARGGVAAPGAQPEPGRGRGAAWRGFIGCGVWGTDRRGRPGEPQPLEVGGRALRSAPARARRSALAADGSDYFQGQNNADVSSAAGK